jgi:hypothetical protein
MRYEAAMKAVFPINSTSYEAYGLKPMPHPGEATLPPKILATPVSHMGTTAIII